MTKDVGTQTDNTLSELLDHHFSLYHTDYIYHTYHTDYRYHTYHTDYSQNNNFRIENPGIFNTDP